MNGFALVAAAMSGLILLVAAAAVGGCLYFVVRTRSKVAAIEGTEASDVADLEDGYGKVFGKAVALDDPLDSPLTGTACVFFHFKVEEQRTRTVPTGTRGQTRTETYWATVVSDRQAGRCGVQDKTGTARVEVLDAETVLTPSGHTTSGLFNDCPKDLQRELSRRYGFSTQGLLFNKGLRYSETVIEEGDKLFVIGDVEVGRSGRPMFVKGDQPFIVSDRKEEKLLGHYRTRMTWGVVGEVAAGVLGLGLAAVPAVMAAGAAAVVPAPVAGGPGAPQGVLPGAAQNAPAPFPAMPQFPALAPQPGEIDRALADLRAGDVNTRRGGAGRLAVMPVDPARRGEVVAALRAAAAADPDVHVRGHSRNALGRWEQAGAGPVNPQPAAPPQAGPAFPPQAVAPAKQAKANPVQDGPHYKQDPFVELPPVAVPWTVTADPAPPAGRPDNPRAVIPLGFLHKNVYFPGLPGSFAAVNPRSPPRTQEIDGLTQVLDLRTARPVGRPFVARVALGERLVVSPDGAYVAGRVSGGAANAVVEVLSAATGQSVRRIEAGHGREFAFPVEFVAPDRLLTMTHEAQIPDPGEKAEYRVWDVRTGRLVAEFAFDLVLHRKWAGLSNGGRYLVFQEAKTVIGCRLVAFDLTTGRVAGDVMLQPKSEPFGQAAGISFSPDGREFAVLWRLGRKPDLWGKVLVFDATTGKRVAEHRLGYVVANFDSLWGEGGPACLQWVPDGSGWLVCGHLIVDRRTGAVTGRVGAEPKWHGEMPPRRFVGRDFVTTTAKAGLDTVLTFEPAAGRP